MSVRGPLAEPLVSFGKSRGFFGKSRVVRGDKNGPKMPDLVRWVAVKQNS